MTYEMALAEWQAMKPIPSDFEGECECFEDDLIELRDDRELKLECLRLAVDLNKMGMQCGNDCRVTVELASEFFEFAIA